MASLLEAEGRLFDVLQPFGPEQCSLLVKKKLGKKPVTQMEVVKEQQTLYLLCDGKLQAHDTTSLAKKGDLIECKSASLFCVEEKVGTQQKWSVEGVTNGKMGCCCEYASTQVKRGGIAAADDVCCGSGAGALPHLRLIQTPTLPV